jgi:hypothetical protein
MFFSRWLRSRSGSRQALAQKRFRPTLCQLEDRITPTSVLPFPPSAPATHFAVTSASTFQAGRPAVVFVEAEDASNLPAYSYAGTVKFTLGTPDAGAVLPANYTFTLGDHGFHQFVVNLSAVGSQIITVTDATNASITGTDSVTVRATPVTASLHVNMPANASAGVPVNVTVVAENAAGQRAWNYSGTVTFSSSDGLAHLPGNYHFTPRDLGRHTFQVILSSAGSQLVTVKDIANGTLTGSAATIVHAAPAATHFVVIGPSNALTGTTTNVVILAVDASGNRDWNYSGAVTLTSSDIHAILPGGATFVLGQFGRLVVPVVFKTGGTQTLTATATTGSPPIRGQASFNVIAVGPVTHFEVFDMGTASVGSPAGVLIVALDANNRVVPGYTGTVHFTSTDGSAMLPLDYTFQPADNGRHAFSVIFNTAGTETLTVTDKSNTSITISVSVAVS